MSRLKPLPHQRRHKHDRPPRRSKGARPFDAGQGAKGGTELDPRAQLSLSGLRAKKSWGQNFLTDQSILADIAAACELSPAQPVVELGAGLGGLTTELLKFGGPVVAVERDRDLVPPLREALQQHAGLEILEADAAGLDYAALSVRLGHELVVAGNLPYQLSSRILVSVADAAPHVRRAVLMVQREVAERVAAGPGSRTYGLLSVLVQRAFGPTVLQIVPPGAFFPRPKVHSAVVLCLRNETLPSPESDRLLVIAARAAFSARRKTLKNAVAGAFAVDPAPVVAALGAAGIDPQARAETLAVPQFIRLGEALRDQGLVAAADGVGAPPCGPHA
ncbi:MAG: ribosomal RNA small subunit methyltransferase A [Deltaproteobacteria bacterium]|nr:ribosomal RNA small subunit methyltransferase A [Deltaproteobacteria bacterium]